MLTTLLILSLFYTNEPVISMREEPSEGSKVVSQTVYAENIKINQESGNWLSITTSDGYIGWIESSRIAERASKYSGDLKTSRLMTHLYGVDDTEFGPIKTVPYGTPLKLLDQLSARWIKVSLVDGKEAYVQKGDVAKPLELDIVNFSQMFLGLPYTWGGRSSFGYDCSGFVQMLYSEMGIQLPRDSKDQMSDSRFQTVAIDDLKPGDLIFFGKTERQIRHVGMSIGNGQFIHATSAENQPWIRISSLADFPWSGNPESSLPFRLGRQLVSSTK